MKVLFTFTVLLIAITIAGCNVNPIGQDLTPTPIATPTDTPTRIILVPTSTYTATPTATNTMMPILVTLTPTVIATFTATGALTATLIESPTSSSLMTATITSGTTFTLTSQGTMPTLPTDASHGKWTISENADINKDPIVRDWLKRLENPNPAQWKYFPNIGNPDRKDFPSSKTKPASWGAEYGEDESPFCENHPCDFVVPAWHYRLITADYSFLGQQCRGTDSTGCLLLLFNVGNKSVIWRNQDADNGFTVMGRYWDGDHLEWAALGLVSHASANMLGMQTFAHPGEPLNFGTGSNAGANCGNPGACTKAIDVLLVISAQERILATAKSTVTK